MRTGELTEEQIRGLLRGGVDPAFRRELECELSWRHYHGRHGPNRAPHEYAPAWLLASALPERRR